MVYCGKPSRACLECRVNRRRCDLSKPSCGQCLRTGSACRGYRDQLDLAFRDQSLDVVRRSQNPHIASSSKRIATSKSNIHAIQRSPPRQMVPDTVTQAIENYIGRALHSRIICPIELQAAPFFLHNYLLGETVPPIDDIDCLSTIFGQASEDYLASIISAIGIASLSNLRREPDLMPDAGHRYARALRGIRAGLAKRNEAISDQMLVGIRLLTVYESVTCKNTDEMKSWDSHMYGTLALLDLRGTKQLNAKTGRRIFLQLRTEVLLSCLQRDTTIPRSMLDLMSEERQFETEEELSAARLSNIIAGICALGDSQTSHCGSGLSNNEKIFQQISVALSMDRDLVTWSTTISSAYKFSTSAAKEPEDYYLGLYHQYSSLWIANTWNLYRCARIFLHEKLIRLLSLHLQDMSITLKTPLNGCSIQSSETVIHECATNICLSVPYILGSCQVELKDASKSRAARGLSLLRPLYIAGAACPAEKSMRDWACLQLNEIGRMTGINKASILASLISAL